MPCILHVGIRWIKEPQYSSPTAWTGTGTLKRLLSLPRLTGLCSILTSDPVWEANCTHCKVSMQSSLAAWKRLLPCCSAALDTASRGRVQI